MNFNQILIRLGVDATAIRGGLARTGAMVKAWGAGLSEEISSKLLKTFAVGYLFEKGLESLHEIKDEILEIKRLSEETGTSTNFIQSLMVEAKASGTSMEALTMPLVKFNQLVGMAKTGHTEAIIKLKDMGVITDQNDLKTLDYTRSIHNLSVAYDKLGDKQQRDALLQEAFGKSAFRMAPIFEKGTKYIDSMGAGNFFSKINSGSINDFSTAWTALKQFSLGATATVVNYLDLPLAMIRKYAQAAGAFAGGARSWGDIQKAMSDADKLAEKSATDAAMAAMAAKDGITVEEEKAKIIDEQNQLLERQAELQGDITDRDKLGVTEMASKTRQIMGIKSPLEMSHLITPRMRTALKIDTLEERAKLAWERGDDKKSNALQSEADQIRRSSPWLKRGDVNPMQKTESELARVNEQLEPVMQMAQLVTKDSKQ
jgi:hypothetical protein